MRRRREASVFTPSLGNSPDAKAPDSQESVVEFQALQAEKSAMALLDIMSIAVPLYLLMYMSQIIDNKLTLQEAVSASPYVLLMGFMCWCRKYLQEKMKRHPLAIALSVQCIGQFFVTYTMVSNALYFPAGLVQHRLFLTQFLPWYLLSAVNLHVPMPVYVTFVCPLYFATWLIFHFLTGSLTPLCVTFALAMSGLIIYARHHQAATLWQEFQAVCAVQRERNALKAMQESFQGILSSIFDASCTCNRRGQLKEFSPHLQELLGLPKESAAPDKQGVFNLCSLAATTAEAERLANFLDCAFSGQCNQASKMQISLRRSGTSSTEVIDAHLTAIPFRDYTLDTNGTDSLFVVFKLQPCAWAACESIQDSAAFKMIWAASESIEDEDACDQSQGLGIMQETYALPEDIDLGAWEDSLSYTMSVTSANQRRLLTMCNAETQTTNSPAADAGVQTDGSFGKPPLLALDERSQRSLRSRVLDEPLRRSQRGVFGKKRRKVFRDFSVTPCDTIRDLLLAYVLDCINPMCSPGCCVYHSLLFFLRNETSSMLRSEPCRNWGTEDKTQCAACYVVQDKEDDDELFQCSYCHAAHAYGRSTLDESPSSGAELTSQSEGDSDP